MNIANVTGQGTSVCRHLAYLGSPVGAGTLLLDAPNALASQVDTPAHQEPGVVNRDGWGIAWQANGRWRCHRSVLPLSEDCDAPGRLRGIHAGALVAAIRRASPGLALVESGNAPFVAGRWVFSLNGFVGGFAEGPARAPLVAALAERRRVALVGDTDTEVLFGILLDRLDDGDEPASAMAGTVAVALDAADDHPSRLNLLLSDGSGIWATRWSNSLCHRRFAGGGLAVASEPWDDDPGWAEVPDRAAVAASDAEVRVTLLA